MMEPADEKEQKCVKALREAFPADQWLDPEDAGFLDGNTYLRFARARDGKEKEAKEMLKAALEWRRTYKPFRITEDDVREAMGEMTLTCGGRCRANRPLLAMTLAVPNKCKAAARVQQLVYILEETQRKGYDSISWIVDFGEMGKHPKDPESKVTRKETMQILQDYYPERLGLMLLYRTPWYIRWSITLARPFLDARTWSKIFIAGHKVEDLAKYVDIEQIPKRMEGTYESDGLDALASLAPYNPETDAKVPTDALPSPKQAAAKAA